MTATASFRRTGVGTCPVTRPHLLLLCGLPFSGKSTLGRALAERCGVVHIEVDREHQGDGTEERRIERTQWIAAYRAAFGKVETALAAGQTVVFDAVSYRKLQRQRVGRIAERFGVPMTVVYLDVTVEEAQQRREINRVTRLRVHVPDEDFAEVASGFQMPGDDERVVCYRPAEPLTEWIDRVIAPILARGDR